MPGWIQRGLTAWHRRQGYRFRGMDVLLLTTTGRVTGNTHETPVVWFRDGEEAWLIVAAAAGSAQHPAWYQNLKASPAQAWIELAGRKLKVTAIELHGQEREERWQRIIAAQPIYAKYQTKTDRELPVIRLIPLQDG